MDNMTNEIVINNLLPIIIDYINKQYQLEITSKELEGVLENTKWLSTPTYSKTCLWEYKRGKRKYEPCGKPTVNKTNYCSVCIKRSALKPKQLNQVKPKNFFEELPINNVNDGYKLELEVFDKQLQLYKERYLNFIFKREDQNHFKLIGKSDYTHDKMVLQLTHEDILKAKALNLPMDEDIN